MDAALIDAGVRTSARDRGHSFSDWTAVSPETGHRVLVGQRLLRRGQTTGTCAAAAAKAAATWALNGQAPRTVSIPLPAGPRLTLDVIAVDESTATATCAVRKDAGDDPDITDGVLVYATVRQVAAGFTIDGGVGIGRVTRPGLDQPVGAAAINSVPRHMIAAAVAEAAVTAGYDGGWEVVIAIPGGEALAARTFNPRLGVVGGLSVLGTTGIVEPMSHAALTETVRREIAVLAAEGRRALLLTLGNFALAFAVDELGLNPEGSVKCSNAVGDALTAAVEYGFDQILVIGHLGKLVKLGLGVLNTHSNQGDGRLETLVTCALAAGGKLPLLRRIAAAATTDAALAALTEAGLAEATLSVLGARIEDTLIRHVPPEVTVGYVCFTRAEPGGVLAQSANARTLMEIWRTA
jgi:cobalt-precorrin-5B (C1)-methyltransferase